MAAHVIAESALAPPIGPYSYAVRAGHLVFLGGVPGTTAEGQMAGQTPGRADVAAQTAEALACARLAVERAGGRWDNLLRLNVFLEDWKRLEEFEASYARLVSTPGPARSLVGYRLAQDSMLVEVEGMAGVDGVTDVVLDGDGDAPSQVGRRLGSLVCLGAVLPLGPEGRVVSRTDVEGQGAVVVERIERALAAAGARAADVVRVRGALADVRVRPGYEAALASRLPWASVASAAVGASLPIQGALLAVEVTAILGSRRVLHILPGVVPPAVLAGDLLVIPGIQSLGLDGRVLDPGDVRAQTEHVLDRLQATVEAAGLGLADVVQTEVTLADFRSYRAYNTAYARYFRPPYPARSTVQAQLGGPTQHGLMIQIEALAAAGTARATTVVTAARSFYRPDEPAASRSPEATAS